MQENEIIASFNFIILLFECDKNFIFAYEKSGNHINVDLLQVELPVPRRGIYSI